MLLLTLRGTPTMYYGDELGLARVAIPSEATQDPWERNEPGLGLSRDPSRTPMQWSGGGNAGFTDGAHPWLPLDTNYRRHNVETLRGNPRSLLNLYRELIRLRRSHRALNVGTFRMLVSTEHTLVYERTFGEERLVVALNFSSLPQALPARFAEARLLLTSYLDREGALGEPTLRGDEGVIVSGV